MSPRSQRAAPGRRVLAIVACACPAGCMLLLGDRVPTDRPPSDAGWVNRPALDLVDVALDLRVDRSGDGPDESPAINALADTGADVRVESSLDSGREAGWDAEGDRSGMPDAPWIDCPVGGVVGCGTGSSPGDMDSDFIPDYRDPSPTRCNLPRFFDRFVPAPDCRWSTRGGFWSAGVDGWMQNSVMAAQATLGSPPWSDAAGVLDVGFTLPPPGPLGHWEVFIASNVTADGSHEAQCGLVGEGTGTPQVVARTVGAGGTTVGSSASWAPDPLTPGLPYYLVLSVGSGSVSCHLASATTSLSGGDFSGGFTVPPGTIRLHTAGTSMLFRFVHGHGP